MKTKFILPALTLAILCSVLTAAQTQQPPLKSSAGAAKTPAVNPLALTDGERKALEPLQQAAIEANQELVAAGDALDSAKAADVLAAAWRWKAALTAFRGALKERGNWIAATGKAKGWGLTLGGREF